MSVRDNLVESSILRLTRDYRIHTS